MLVNVVNVNISFIKRSIPTTQVIFHLRPRLLFARDLVCLSFFAFGLVEHHVKNGRSSGNEKALIQNENCEVFFNDVKCEDEIMEETQEDSSLQIRKVNYFKMMKKKMKKNLELLHSQRKK